MKDTTRKFKTHVLRKNTDTRACSAGDAHKTLVGEVPKHLVDIARCQSQWR
jgi:hypothetical protein